MATIRPGRVVLSSIEIDKALDKRMRKAIKHSDDLAFVKESRRRAPWIRAAIAEKCDRAECRAR